MKWLKLFLFFLACLAVQVKLPFYFLGIPLAAEILFISAVFFGIVNGSSSGLVAGAMAGALQGAVSQAPFVLNFFSFTLIAGLAGFFRLFLFTERMGTRLALLELLTLFLFATRLLYFTWAEQPFPFWVALMEGLLPLLLWNALLAFPVFLAMKGMGLLRSGDPDRENRSADFFRGFRRRLAGQSSLSAKREFSWK